jgi:mono/diheme cytochrome c family protein
MFWVGLLFWWASPAVPQQVQRGEAIFMESAHGCTNCHALKGRGTAVGPDLSVIGRLGPQGIAMAIRSTATQYVQEVKLKSGDSFPGMPAGTAGNALKFFDVSKMPPELRQVEQTDLRSALSQDTWKHPPALAKYTSEQIADVIAYIRYSVTGNTKAVDPAEVE